MSALSRRPGFVAGVGALLTLVAAAWQSGYDRIYASFSGWWQWNAEPMLGLADTTAFNGLTGSPGRLPVRSINCREQRASENPPGRPPLFGITCYIGGSDVLTFGNESNDKNSFENDPLIANNQRSARLGKVARL
jgi:hypothetical protein